MVRWYDPGDLLRLGLSALAADIFGRYADQRVLQALNGPAEIYDVTAARGDDAAALEPAPRLRAPGRRSIERPPVVGVRDPRRGAGGPVVIDYAADVGDGWESTCAIARAMAAEQSVEVGGGRLTLPPGEVLIFGGDEVYAKASREEYESRLVAPYTEAFASASHWPNVFAIPGNHDWYDGLVSFSRLFCSASPLFAPSTPPGTEGRGCRTWQNRSYFALKLPADWWLLGTDVQLDSDIDGPQFDYFSAVAALIPAHGRVLLATPEPHWVYDRWRMEDGDSTGLASSHALRQLEALLGDRIKVYLAGDAHHYMAYTNAEHGIHWITCGGGGAFLHPTHGPFLAPKMQVHVGWRAEDATLDAAHVQSYPDADTSRRRTLAALAFPLYNSGFGIVPGAVYVIILWLMLPWLPEAWRLHESSLIQDPARLADLPAMDRLAHVWGDAVKQAVYVPVPLDWHTALRVGTIAAFALLVAACVAFVDSRVRGLRRIALGSAHALIHVIAATMLTTFGTWFFMRAPQTASGWGVVSACAAVIALWVTDAVFFSRSRDSFFATVFSIDGVTVGLTILLAQYFVPFLSLEFARFWSLSLFTLAAGWILGSIIFGIYLFVMLNVLGLHWNETMSAIRTENYKSFLRLVFAPEGQLTIYPMKIEDPDAADTKAELIGTPLTVSPDTHRG